MASKLPSPLFILPVWPGPQLTANSTTTTENNNKSRSHFPFFIHDPTTTLSCQTSEEYILIVNMSLFVDKASERTASYIAAHIAAPGVETVADTNLCNFANKIVGKVRDVYSKDGSVIMIATDRLSAFDRRLNAVPFKGRVLNQTSLWWFRTTQHIVPNHVIASPHPNVVIGKKCSVFAVEFVVRGYMTGTTSTSIWTNYAKGAREYCGHTLPDGLVKNQKLESNLLTPTTKDEHDELISAEEIVRSGRMSQEDWDQCAAYALRLFAFSQEKTMEKGLILVDTKYEFGKDEMGRILLIDEIQTPDSSRYWVASSYEERMRAGQEPENIDKEFIRKWYVANCDPYHDEVLPEPPAELIHELSRRYIMLYELITGETFDFASAASSPSQIEASVDVFFAAQPQPQSQSESQAGEGKVEVEAEG